MSHYNARSRFSRELAIAAALAAALAGPALAGGGAIVAPGAPAAIGGATPAGNPNAEGPRAIVNASSVIGKIQSVNKDARTLMLDNGQTYAFATNLDVANVTPGQSVTLTLETTGNTPTVVKIGPAN